MKRRNLDPDGTPVSLDNQFWLNMDSSQLGQEHAEERHEQSFAPYPGVVHELKEAEVQRKLFLRDCRDGGAARSAAVTRSPQWH